VPPFNAASANGGAVRGFGVGIGPALTMGLNAFLAQWAKGNSRDPAILLTGAMLLGLASAIASALPAWHASKLDPMTALRSE
jgi:ABC-type antimicrobial peptide transport system permease subunit